MPTHNIMCIIVNNDDNSENKIEKISEPTTSQKKSNVTEKFRQFVRAVTSKKITLAIAILKENNDIVFERDENMKNALMFASEYNQIELVKLLLELKSPVNATNNKDNTALMYAARFGNLDIVKMLANEKAYIDQQNVIGFTAIHIAVAMHHTAVVDFLLKESANFNIPNYDDITPLKNAVIRNFPDVVALMRTHSSN